mmetsp:Transcript_25130/g.25484  ORF Transcript_25130/g.25484 Transcript_25130/m.25484 type:complete len:176 (-) Transcript_25130:171-698(-)
MTQQLIGSSTLSILYTNKNSGDESRNDGNYRKILRSFVLADITALSQKIKAVESSGQGNSRIFQDAMKLEIETLKDLEKKIIDDDNNDDKKENDNIDDETLSDDGISIPGGSSLVVRLSSSSSMSSCTSKKRLLSRLNLPLGKHNNKKKHWRRSIQGPIRESSVMEMVFYEIHSV